MSRSLSAAGRNVGRLARSTRTPDGFSRGRRMVVELELPITDDTAGDMIFTPAPQAEVEDKWSRLDAAIVAVEKHALVKEFGFPPDALITAVNSDHPVAMGFEVLEVTLAACQAVRELAELAGKAEVCKILGWTDPAPEFLKAFGADRLFRSAAALQGRIAEIKAERSRPAATSNGGATRARLTLPGRQATAPQALSLSKGTPRTLAGVPTEAPEGSDWLGRVTTAQGMAYRCTCGCGVMVLEVAAMLPPFEVMRERQGSRVSYKDMWRHAFAPRCIRTWGRGFSLVETRDRAFKAEQEAIARRAPQAPRPVRPPPPRPACFGSSDKGASPEQKAKKTARAEADRQRTLATKGKK